MNKTEKESTELKFTSGQITIIIAILTGFFAIGSSLIQGIMNNKLEKKRLETELILKSAITNDIDQRNKNLRFFIKAGFIKDKKNKIRDILNDSIYDLKLPENFELLEKKTLSGTVMDINGKKLEGVSISYLPQNLVENNVPINLPILSDKNGEFVYSNLYSDKFFIYLHKDSYETAKIETDFTKVNENKIVWFMKKK